MERSSARRIFLVVVFDYICAVLLRLAHHEFTIENRLFWLKNTNHPKFLRLQHSEETVRHRHNLVRHAQCGK